MYQTIFLTHKIVVILFLLIYLIKTVLLLSNSNGQLAKFSKIFKVPEMIVSFLFLITGGYMLMEIPEINSFMIIKLIAVFVSIPLAIIGFKKSNKLLAGLSLILLIAAYGLAEMSKKRGSKPESTTSPTTTDGKEIYSAYCTKCHGDDGKMGLVGATDLSTSSLDQESAIEIIKKGKNAMAGFQKQLSDEQIAAVAEYVETLRN